MSHNFFQQNSGAEVTQTRQTHSQKLRATCNSSSSTSQCLDVDSTLGDPLPVFLVTDVKCAEIEQPVQGHTVTSGFDSD